MKIFLSSTCYDLAEGVRSTIEEFLKQFGHEVLLSEKANFPLEAGIHRQENCIRQVEACDYFIVIIGTRAGAPYYQDDSISVTHAEFKRAKELNKPMICFVRHELIAERLILIKNQQEGINIKLAFAQKPSVYSLINEIQGDNVAGVWLHPYTYVQDILEKLESDKTIYSGDRIIFYTLSSVSELYENFFHEYSRKIDMEIRTISVRTHEIEEAIKKTNDELLLLELPLIEAVNVLEHSPFNDELCVIGMTYNTPPIERYSDFEKFSLYWTGDPQKSFDHKDAIKLFLNVGESSIATVLAKLFAMTKNWKVDLYADSVSIQLSMYEDILRYAKSLPGVDKKNTGIAFVLSGKAEREFRRLEPNIAPIIAEHHLMKLFINEAVNLNSKSHDFNLLKKGLPGTLILARRKQVLEKGGPRFSQFFYHWEKYVSNVNNRKYLEDLLFHPIARMLPWAIENTMLFIDAISLIESKDKSNKRHLLNNRLNVWKFMPLINFSNKKPYFDSSTIDAYKALYTKQLMNWKNDFIPPRKIFFNENQNTLKSLKDIEKDFEALLSQIENLFIYRGIEKIIGITLINSNSDSEKSIDDFKLIYKQFDQISDEDDSSDNDIFYFKNLYNLLLNLFDLQQKCVIFDEQYYRF